MNITLEYINETNENIDIGEDIEELSVKVIERCLNIHHADDDFMVSLTIVDEDTIKEINKEQRNIDSVTDVLSFPNLEFESEGDFSVLDSLDYFDICDPETEAVILGDIVICLNRAKEQASEYGHSLKREIMFLIAHSMLHLCGYDHMEEAERERMEEKQREILDYLGITR